MAPANGTNSYSQSQSQTQSQSRSVSHLPSSPNTGQLGAPPASDAAAAAAAADALAAANAVAMLKQRYATCSLAEAAGASGRGSQLHQLSAIAAAQDRMGVDPAACSRKRMADGEVKPRGRSISPLKAHSRTTSASAASITSTPGSTLGELSAELKTRLSYAMVKVNHGWQTRSLDEVEGLASQASSPTSSTSAAYRRSGSSASPRLAQSAPASQARFANPDPTAAHRCKSTSPPTTALSHKPKLAPPAPVRPSAPAPAPAPRSNPRSNPRRSSSPPRSTPTMLSRPHLASSSSSSSFHATPRSSADPVLYSPHKNVREQDAIETLLFMSSPGNSASLKHGFSPSGSPGPHSAAPLPGGAGNRHALPSGPRRGLPSNRPSLPGATTRGCSDKSPPGRGSPQQYHTPKRPAVGCHRTTLSLPSGLGIGNGTRRKVPRDEDIERMLDCAGAELADSSDDEEIQLPPGRNGLARVMGA
ncbi:uncharacterized protein UV8b_00604 [Ustilaginoidea virens]|uniref:Cyclin-dependent kinase n=1 Tax=Ustilaginoidea virens TaxID=1159556 RepID=A0A8E5HJ55_USTVR|nr:uncharacterized protein UV8b_00604 [Ustilaginoidea virens]QUC16363.1 hypothetical protein UV8b_00604 [Ustilaginoidea virens]